MADIENEGGYLPSRNEILLSAMMMSASGALHDTLLILAKSAHDGRPGQWLTELEASFVTHAKQTGAVGLSMDIEIAAVEAAIANIRRVIDWVKSDLDTGFGESN
jgi:2-methylisocitrate lyase-like PEP mutase family enzyme